MFELSTPDEMLDMWQSVECECDPSVGWICERCHDTQVVQNLLKELDGLRNLGSLPLTGIVLPDGRVEWTGTANCATDG